MIIKPCQNCDNSFLVTDQDLEFYKRIDVPEPTRCANCRHLRRHGHINDYVYYTRKCDGCEKTFISVFPPKSEYKVFCHDCFYSEKRDHFKEGRDYDFNRAFFDQFNVLLHAVPQLGMVQGNCKNSDYCESVANCKDCYLISESSNCEDCLYGYWLQKSKDCLDCTYIHECERSYELIYCFNCYNLKYSYNCYNCNDSYFLENCIGCQDCVLSTNLRHKQYYIYNKPYTKDQYFTELKKINLQSRQSVQKLKKKFNEFLKTQPRKNLQIENAENCTGDYIRNAKNCRNVFHCYEAEECAYGEHIWRGAKYCVDSNTAGRNAELLYETTNSGIDSYNLKFCRYCWGSDNSEYCNQCVNGSHLFGCTSLKPGAQYCILNKQYSPEEYQRLVTQIKTQMLAQKEYGEFFPLVTSLFGYNNSVSYDELPLTKEQILTKDWKWEDQTTGTTGKGTIKNVPDTLADSILKEILTCTNCSKNYKIVAPELAFYKTANIPIPDFCPDCRHRARLATKNKKTLHQTNCANCKNPTQTTLDPAQYSKILCKKCYLETVY